MFKILVDGKEVFETDYHVTEASFQTPDGEVGAAKFRGSGVVNVKVRYGQGSLARFGDGEGGELEVEAGVAEQKAVQLSGLLTTEEKAQKARDEKKSTTDTKTKAGASK